MSLNEVREQPLPHLETFAQAAERSSFTAAGAALGLTQAAVSQRIGALERTLRVALFRRQGGRVLLTDAGRTLYAFAQRILALHREARQAVTGRIAPVTGELTIAASSVPGEHLLPRLLPAYRKRHPHVRVRVTIADTQEVLRLLEHGQAHLGLVGGRSDNPHLEFRPFACDRMVLVMRPKHGLARRRQVSLAEFARQPLVLREAGSGSRWCLERALREAGKSLRDLNVVLELGSNEAIKEAVQRGLGAAVLSRHAVEKELKAKRLHAANVAGLTLERDIFVAHDRRRVLPIPARLFLDFFETRIGRASP